jgi:hypothetical protein
VHSAPPSHSIRLAASFTIDPLVPAMAFWVKELGLDAGVDVAPYGQLLQSLLDPGSLLNSRARGANVVFLNVRDWLHELPDEQTADPGFVRGYLDRTAADFENALRTHRSLSSADTVLVVCPAYGAISAGEGDLLRETRRASPPRPRPRRACRSCWPPTSTRATA